MKASSKLSFVKKSDTRSVYVLTDIQGRMLPDFTAIIKRDKNPDLIGKQKIIFDYRLHNKEGDCRKYLYCFKAVKLLTSFNFTDEHHPDKAFGDFGNYALLIRFSNEKEKLEIWAYEGQASNAESFFENWVSGASPELEVVECNALELNGDKKPDTADEQ